MAEDKQIVAVGLLTRNDLVLLGEGFNRAYPVYDDTDFADLLKAIDDADLKQTGLAPRPAH